MSEGPAWLNAVAALVGAVIAVPGTRLYDRRQARRQANADAGATEASTMETVDRIARTWIHDLEAKIDELAARLALEVDNRRTLVGHVDVLEDHINEGKPPPPPARPPLQWWHPTDRPGPT